MPRPPATIDIREVQVIKDDRAFFMTDDFGDIPRDNTAALGLYCRDTRYLSRFELTLNQLRPLLLHSSSERDYSQIVEVVFPMRHVPLSGHPERNDNISVHRFRILSGALHERLRIRNYGLVPRRITAHLDFEADFRDVFEVRGFERDGRGEHLPPRVERSRVVLGYRGTDGAVRTTTLRFSPMPRSLTESEAAFELELAPGEEAEVAVEVAPDEGDGEVRRRSIGEVDQALRQDYTAWTKRCTRFATSNPQLSGFLQRAVLDLRMLTSSGEDGTRYIDAGVPWYSALFGRDSLITAYQAVAVSPDLVWGTLRGLAALQGKEVDDWREEEPGKVPHEVRVGELAAAGEIPHTPYYGTVDATPLWLVVLAAAHRWTGDLDAVRELWPNALAALRWIDEHGDADGDGYVEYRRRSPGGLENQGWKDSFDGVCHPDGTPAEPPIALVEVQGYVYQARLRMAVLARLLGETDLAEQLEHQATELRRRFNRDFWMQDLGYYALALDAEKRPVPTVTSNPGHCLWSGIVDRERAPAVVRRLISPTLLSGWGIRTLATRQPAYDPIGYHTGSIWPHDNSLIAHGMKRYRFDDEARQVLDQLTRAGAYFPYGRYPELFCGFSSEEVPVPVQYPVACRPQAWASGTPLLMVRSYAGLTADAANRRLYIVRPRLPRWLEWVEIRGLRVGDARLDLTFSNHDGVTATQVPRKEGDLEILIRQ